MSFIEAKDVLLRTCPLCGKSVRLFKYREQIQCKIICTNSECATEFIFKRGMDSKDVLKKWNYVFTEKSCQLKSIELDDTESTLCMQGPNQFKTVKYRPTCHCGYPDCIWDPAYILATYPEWYTRLHGKDTNPEDVSCEKQGFCKDGERYDDEDK